MLKKSLMALALALVGAAASVQAATCGSVYRTGTLDSADSCFTSSGTTGTPNAADVLGKYPGDPWTKEGANTANGTNGALTTTLTSGSWGSGKVAGTWSISSGFWDNYGEAVISFHVGNGNKTDPTKDPDWWFFEIADGATSGTFSYEVLPQATGGGFSNMFLWGRGEPTEVPVPGTLGLLGLGLLGLGAVRRKQQA